MSAHFSALYDQSAGLVQWSPDGRLVAMAVGQRLVVRDVNGFEIVQVWAPRRCCCCGCWYGVLHANPASLVVVLYVIMSKNNVNGGSHTLRQLVTKCYNFQYHLVTNCSPRAGEGMD